MKIIKINQLQQHCKKMNFKFVGLNDRAGRQLVPYNNPRIPIEQRIKEITNMTGTLQPDYYIVKGKQYNNPSATIYECLLQVGEPEQQLAANGQPVQIMHIPVQNEPKHIPDADVRTYADALADKSRIAELEMKLQQANETIEELNQELNAGLAEDTPNTMSQLKEAVLPFMPILDRFLDIREKEIDSKKSAPKPAPVFRKPQPQQQQVTPVQQWVIYLNNLDEAAFEQELQYLQLTDPELYALVLPEVWEEESEQQQTV